MSSARKERMDALSEAILRLLKRQEETDRRLDRIEQALGIAPPEAPPAPAPVVEPAATPLPPPPSLDTGRPRVFETRMGLTWINRVAVVTCALAVTFFFKYAVDNQWIGETGRVVLGVVTGLVLLAGGERFWRGGQRIYGQGLCGLGAAVLYLSFYATFGFYRLLPQSVAFLLMLFTTVLAGALAVRYSALAVAAMALLGGYATPILLSTGEDRPWFLFSYIVVLNAGALLLARFQGWRRLELLALLATLFVYLGWIDFPVRDIQRTPAVFFALLFYAQFASVNQRWIFSACQVLAPLLVAAAWHPQPAPYFIAVLALSAAGLVAADRRPWPEAATVTLGAFFLSALVFDPDRTAVPLPAAFLFLSVAFLLFLLWVPWRVLIRKRRAEGLDLVVPVLNAAVYFGISYFVLDPDYESLLGLFAILLACVHLVLAWKLWDLQPSEGRDTRPVLLSLGVALILLVLAAPIQFTGFRITMAWALEAAALSWIGGRVRSRRLHYAALAVFFLALERLIAVDSWIYSGPHDFQAIANARFLTFVTAAACLWAAAWWVRTATPAWMALATYVAGHFAMLWILSLEVLAWAGRAAAAENLDYVESTTVSILMAAYAVMLVALGVGTRSSLNRILGLALIAFVVAKLYFYDVWLLRRIYRVAAFAGLGALLLVMSYLYSRFRATIESWWKDEASSGGPGGGGA